MVHQFESGFFTSKPAWHDLGTVVTEAPHTEEAIKLAGLDWQVQERDLLAADPSDSRILTACPDHKALVRSTDQKILGVVGKQYVPLQNEKAFSFFNPFLDNGFAKLETAGSLKEGKRVWVLAKMKGVEGSVVKNDEVVGYLLLSNSHDGSQAVRVQFTNVRVVCWNTLSQALKNGDLGIESCLRVRHTSKMEVSLDAIQTAVDIANTTFSFSVEAYQALAKKRLPIEGLEKYVREVMQVDVKAPTPRAFNLIEKAYEDGPGANIPGVIGTYWGAYNAVTHWIDHSRGHDDSKRLDSTWFGLGKNIRDRAFNVALSA